MNEPTLMLRAALLLAACLTACSAEPLVVDLDLRRDPCNEAAGECCETWDLSALRSARLELAREGRRELGPCQAVADLGAVAPMSRPLLIEQALASGAIPGLDEGQWAARVVGYDQPGCAPGRVVLCGRGQLTVPGPEQRGSLALIIRCSPDAGSAKQAVVQRCVAESL